MRTASPYLLILALSLLAVSAANAQTPEPTRGKVLLLDNDRILEGDIEKINGQYRIRRSIGELWVPADRSKRLCRDLDDCYEVMKRETNLKDADERLRLARWCQMNGLKHHALNEAQIALDMRPEHPESVNMVKMLQRFAISSSPALSKQPSQTTIRPVMAQRAPLDVSSESYALFSTRVQPVLMNTCISCHSHGKGGNFQLVRVADGGTRASTQANLNAALEFINVEKPVLSPLIIKSVVAHGGATAAPVKGRQSPAFLTLQTWVDQVIEGNPHLKEIRQAEGSNATTSAKKDYFNEVFAPPTSPVAPLPLPGGALPGGETKLPEVVSRPTPLPSSQPDLKGPTPPSNLPPAATPAVAPPAVNSQPRDPFDPAEFNSRPK